MGLQTCGLRETNMMQWIMIYLQGDFEKCYTRVCGWSQNTVMLCFMNKKCMVLACVHQKLTWEKGLFAKDSRRKGSKNAVQKEITSRIS